MWHPSEDDLTPVARDRLEVAYGNRERLKCSRKDFADGYMAALRDMAYKFPFNPDRYRDEEA